MPLSLRKLWFSQNMWNERWAGGFDDAVTQTHSACKPHFFYAGDIWLKLTMHANHGGFMQVIFDRLSMQDSVNFELIVIWKYEP